MSTLKLESLPSPVTLDAIVSTSPDDPRSALLKFCEANKITSIFLNFRDIRSGRRLYINDVSNLASLVKNSEGHWMLVVNTDGSSFPALNRQDNSDIQIGATGIIRIENDNQLHINAFFLHRQPQLDGKTPLRDSRGLIQFSYDIDSRDVRGIAKRTDDHIAYVLGKNVKACIGAEREFFAYQGAKRTGIKPENNHYMTDLTPQENTLYRGMTEAAKKVAPGQVVGMHKEVAHSQFEMVIKYAIGVLNAADQTSEVIEACEKAAGQQGYTVNKKPKPIEGINGSGQHCNISLQDFTTAEAVNLFVAYDDKKCPVLDVERQTYQLSELAYDFIAGVLKHMPAICAFANPSVASYRRLDPKFEAPNTIIFGANNRGAAIRLPDADDPRGIRIEVRSPDGLSTYLTYAAIMQAGLDGIRNKWSKTWYEGGFNEFIKHHCLHRRATAEEKARLPHLPSSLKQSLAALEKDHAFLQEGGVFTPDFITAYIGLKRNEIVEYAQKYYLPSESTPDGWKKKKTDTPAHRPSFWLKEVTSDAKEVEEQMRGPANGLPNGHAHH